MEFDLKKSRIYKAVSFSKLLVLGPLKLWRIVFLTISITALGFYAVSILGDLKLISNADALLGLFYVSFPLFISMVLFEIFFNYFLKHPKIKDGQNFAEFLDFDAAWVLDGAVSTNKLLLAISNYAPAQSILTRMGIGQDKLKKLFKNIGGKGTIEDLSPLLTDAYNSNIKEGRGNITMMDLLTSLFDHNQVFKQLLIEHGLDKGDLDSLATWYESNDKFHRKRKMFWNLDNLLRRPPIGIGWVYGHPWYLGKYATDLTRQFQQKQAEINLVGRKRTVDEMEQVLSRSGQNNILLVGEAGVGKRTVVLGFTQMVARGQALPALNYKRVFELNLPLIASSSKEITEVQNTLILLLEEARRAGNIVLIIEELHNFIGSAGGMGHIDISGILLPFLESTDIQIIATTDPVNYHKYIESRSEITKVFEKVDVDEPDIAETLKIIEGFIPNIEYKNNIFLTYGAIKNIVESADRYIRTSPMPEKAVDLLAETVSYAKSHKKSVIFAQDVNEVVTLKTEIPRGAVSGGEKEKLINLESEMHKEVIGQDAAVKAVAQTMRRLRAGLVKRGKPAGVFLFAGPTGVGKTLTAKILAKIYFGSPDKMLRFDMSEYQNTESLDRFLGSLRINEPGQLASRVRDNPFSLILLDEIEKAHKNILNIFLSIFDEGSMTDVFGRKVSFEQNIIIATSNAAADLIRDMVNRGIDPSAQKEKVIDALVREHYFSPELLNRFDELVVFHPLTKDQVRQITELLINKLAERMREQGYIFKPTLEIIEHISEVGFDPQFGARPMQRAIQDKIETAIANKILAGSIQKGLEFTLSPNEMS